ncbi:MAG: dTMP kinase [Puniceicoccaceae bacterium MED-G32]|nr:MAG: dTMP kinase [Puniceicoccaceae bacterium MED-G32]CAI8303581.1 MAG: Thymidylate kinase [Puniceicoccaceae bacterium MED-G32]
MNGYFITFEGSEGCGKTTQIEALAKALEAQGKTVLITREPGGTLIGEKIRNLLQDPSHKNDISDMTELLLFSASRAELITSRIQPALARGEIVICDRFYDSTFVYQGLGRAIDMNIVEQLNQITVGTLKPDLTILLDLDAKIGIERAKSRQSGELDRIENESLAFFEAVRNGYLELAKKEPERFKTIDGLLSVDAIKKIIWDTVVDQF